MKSFFENIPEEMFESAKIDGASEVKILINIVIPLSVPVLMTVLLFYMIGHWNEFFQAILYITKPSLEPLQVVVRQILTQSNMDNPDVTIPTQTLQCAVVIFATVPIVAVYPFIQKHLTKGMMLGAIKG
jgi:putative aldouronate transport system permease protein